MSGVTGRDSRGWPLRNATRCQGAPSDANYERRGFPAYGAGVPASLSRANSLFIGS
jgi:hypothetical protein